MHIEMTIPAISANLFEIDNIMTRRAGLFLVPANQGIAGRIMIKMYHIPILLNMTVGAWAYCRVVGIFPAEKGDDGQKDPDDKK